MHDLLVDVQMATLCTSIATPLKVAGKAFVACMGALVGYQICSSCTSIATPLEVAGVWLLLCVCALVGHQVAARTDAARITLGMRAPLDHVNDQNATSVAKLEPMTAVN